MTDRFEKSMQTLELPRVLDMLADQAVTEEGKDKARRLRPETDPVEVTALLAETTAAVEKMVLGGSPAFAGVRPVAGSLQRANMGGSLNTRELLDIAKVLARRPVGQGVRRGGRGEENAASTVLFHSLRPNRFLEDKITGSIVGDGRAGRLRQPGAGVHPPPHAGHGEQGPGYSAAASSPPPRPSICRRAIITHALRAGTWCP